MNPADLLDHQVVLCVTGISYAKQADGAVQVSAAALTRVCGLLIHYRGRYCHLISTIGSMSGRMGEKKVINSEN